MVGFLGLEYHGFRVKQSSCCLWPKFEGAWVVFEQGASAVDSLVDGSIPKAFQTESSAWQLHDALTAVVTQHVAAWQGRQGSNRHVEKARGRESLERVDSYSIDYTLAFIGSEAKILSIYLKHQVSRNVIFIDQVEADIFLWFTYWEVSDLKQTEQRNLASGASHFIYF